MAQAFAKLRGDAKVVVDGILQGEYTFWLGSRISFGRFPGLAQLVFRLLKALWDKDPDPNGPYRAKFKEIVARAPGLVKDNTDPATWADKKKKPFLAQRVPQYSEIFKGEVVVANVPQLLKRGIIDIPAIYDDPGIQADAEHTFIIALIREGVVSELVTTNWDPLLERAEEAARGSPCRIVTRIGRPSDRASRCSSAWLSISASSTASSASSAERSLSSSSWRMVLATMLLGRRLIVRHVLQGPVA